MLDRNDENIRGGGIRFSRSVRRGLRRALGACLAVAALTATTAGGAYADDLTATRDTGATAGATRVADGDTTKSYADVLGDANSTRYNGRVWTDKTVTTGDQPFTTADGADLTTVANDSDFLVTYSALATTTRVVQEHPNDTVFVLDFSKTMNELVDGTEIKGDTSQLEETRLAIMLGALDNAIADLAEASGNNRIGVVVFYGASKMENAARILLPMTPATQIPQQTDTPEGEPEAADCTPGASTCVGEQGNLSTTDHGYFTITKFWYEHDDGNFTRSKVQCNLPKGSEIETGGWTPIQSGLYDALDMIETAAADKANGARPNIVLMSDGMPNAASMEGSNWYHNLDTSTYRTLSGAAPYFVSILMASYLKQQVTDLYGTDCGFYTIGLSETQTPDFEFVLDPGTYADGADTSSNIQETIDAWQRYTSAETDTTTVTVGDTAFDIARNNDETVTPTDIDYADQFYEATTADELINAFGEITSSILAPARIPTEVTGPLDQSGWITYEDPIGEYMEFKEFKTMIFMDKILKNPTVSDPVTDAQGNQTTTYTFNGDITNPVVPDQSHNVSEIRITVTQTQQGTQTLKVEIPASAIPLRMNTIELAEDGSVVSNETSGNLPFRLCYTVGLRDGITPETLKYEDGSQAVSDDYIQANTADQGRGVHLYSNDFNRADETNPATAKAKVTFTPADDNPFYFIQEDTPLYTDEDCKTPATEVTDNGTYYFQITYYQGTEMKTAVVKRAGSLMSGYVNIGSPKYLVKGAPRLGNLEDVTAKKTTNETDTASKYREPTFEGAPQTGRFVVYLGNNGRMTLNPTMDGKAQVDVQKTLKGRPWTENDAFTFTITPQNGAPLPDKGDDIIVDQDRKTATLTVRAPQDGETTGTGSFTITIPSGTNVPTTYTYEIKEQKGDAPSMDYDAGILTVTITVEDDSDDPDLRLDTDVAYQYQGADTGDTDSDGEFTNTFTPVSELPFTGGRGTGLTVILGGIVLLMLAGGTWLLARRNRN
ncbi:Spy0128 family protein [Bifidobacterium pullorum]|uniref:Spy0128 family protein n=1 Tax=Bifidobacterium pullorum TaxID=78448 RepID=UPI0009E07FE4|nr:FctA domain-containing protein [Bifidobacterium pullorum]